MGTRYRFSAYDEDRILRSIMEAIATRSPSAVISADSLALEDVGVRASGWGKLTSAEMRFVRDTVADLVATREAESFR